MIRRARLPRERVRLGVCAAIFLVAYTVFLLRFAGPAPCAGDVAEEMGVGDALDIGAVAEPRVPGNGSVLVSSGDASLLADQVARAEEVKGRILGDMPKCAAKGRAKAFLLVFMGHSGSTAIMSSLQQHTDTFVTGFEPVDHGVYITESLREASLRAVKYTYGFFRNGTMINKTAGFKIRPRNIAARPQSFKKVVSMFNARIIWSYRTNVFKQAVGTYSIKYLGDRQAYEGIKTDREGNALNSTGLENRKTRFRVHNMDALHEILMGRVAGDMQVAAALNKISPDGCVLPVSYESFLSKPDVTMQRIQRFLGVNMNESHPALRAKATKDSLCDVVENWADVCEAFFGCVQWRWMLDDYENGCTCSALNPSQFKASRRYCRMERPRLRKKKK